VLFVVMPFLFWRSTWFGLPLSDKELDEAFADAEHPRKIQHALAQLADRMARGDTSARGWYPHVMAAAAHKQDEIRLTAAWVMGQDPTHDGFRQKLLSLVRDTNPMVRHNAALALVRFGDATGRDNILSMLHPHVVTVPGANSSGGEFAPRLQPGDVVNPGTLLARIRAAEGETEIRSQVPGRLERWLAEKGASVVAGQPVAQIEPSADMVWEALRALALIGQPDDLPLIENYFRPREGFPEQVARQAQETAKAIRAREAKK
jgi:biotin carboxyl carrier protein